MIIITYAIHINARTDRAKQHHSVGLQKKKNENECIARFEMFNNLLREQFMRILIISRYYGRPERQRLVHTLSPLLFPPFSGRWWVELSWFDCIGLVCNASCTTQDLCLNCTVYFSGLFSHMRFFIFILRFIVWHCGSWTCRPCWERCWMRINSICVGCNWFACLNFNVHTYLPFARRSCAQHLDRCRLSDDVCTQCTQIEQTKQNKMKKTRIHY